MCGVVWLLTALIISDVTQSLYMLVTPALNFTEDSAVKSTRNNLHNIWNCIELHCLLEMGL